MKQFISVVYLVTLSFVSLAQQNTILPQGARDANPPTEQEEENVKNVTLQFYENMQAIANSKENNIEPVSKLLDKEFSATRYIIDVSGRQTKSTINIDWYKMQLAVIQSIPGLKVTFDVERINFVRAYERFAIINYTLMVNATLENETVLRFRSQVTNYLKKQEGSDWKLFESNGVNVFKEQEIGICPCTIIKPIKTNDTKYEVKLLYPAGNTFDFVSLNYDFKPAGNKTLIVSKNDAYVLENDELTLVKKDNKPVSEKMGKANSNVNVITTIINKQFADKCIGFKAITTD
jgi:hypothetical protein